MGLYGFKKSERLARKKHIEVLFSEAHTLPSYPFRVYYCVAEMSQSRTHQVLISIPKRNIRQAVSRNKIKRRTREAYRLNKKLLPENPTLLIGFIYTSKKIEPYVHICKAIVQTITKLNRKFLPHKTKTQQYPSDV